MPTQLLIAPTQKGTVAVVAGFATIIGTGTSFTSDDIGKQVTVRTTAGDKTFTITAVGGSGIIVVDHAPDVTQSGCFFTKDWNEIDLYDDFPYSVNYSIADIREPDKRNSTLSKTIKIPGSKVNDQVLGFIFEIDSDSSFNPNLRADAVLLVDTVQVMRGNMQLLQINRLGDRIEYEVAVFGNVGDLFLAMGDKDIIDLDWTDLDHSITKLNVENSWTAPVGSGYIYSLYDNGYQEFDTSSPVFSLRDMMPGVYVKEIIDRIFSSAGYTYNSNFLGSNFFKRLFITPSKNYRRTARFNYTINATNNSGADIFVWVYLIKKDITGAVTYWSNNTVIGAAGFTPDFLTSTDFTIVSDGASVTLGPNSGAIEVADMSDGDLIYVAIGQDAFQHIGILSLEFHVDKLSRPLL